MSRSQQYCISYHYPYQIMNPSINYFLRISVLLQYTNCQLSAIGPILILLARCCCLV